MIITPFSSIEELKEKVEEVWDWVEIILLESGKKDPRHSDKFLSAYFIPPQSLIKYS